MSETKNMAELREWAKVHGGKPAAEIAAEEEARRTRQNNLEPDVVALWEKIDEYEQDILYLRKTVHDLARRLATLENNYPRIG